MSLLEGTLAAILVSNAVTKDGYSNVSPEKLGGSLIGISNDLCCSLNFELNSVELVH